VDEPTLADDLLDARLDQLHRVLAGHRALGDPAGALEAESRLALIADRIARRLGRTARPGPPGLAGALRDLLDARLAGLASRPGPHRGTSWRWWAPRGSNAEPAD
jgi:hypothetical protein